MKSFQPPITVLQTIKCFKVEVGSHVEALRGVSDVDCEKLSKSGSGEFANVGCEKLANSCSPDESEVSGSVC